MLLPSVMAHRVTCARCTNPFGVLHFAPARIRKATAPKGAWVWRRARPWLARFGGVRYPACRYTRPLASDPADDGGGSVTLGTDPETGLALTLCTGRYGRYVP